MKYYMIILVLSITLLVPRYGFSQSKTKSSNPENKSQFQILFNKLIKQEKVASEVKIEDIIRNPPVRNPFIHQLPKKVVIVDPPKPDIIPDHIDPIERIPIPPKKVEVTPPALNISGIIWNSERPQAIVNDQIVDIGDEIEKSIIKEINKDSIVIMYADREFNLSYSGH